MCILINEVIMQNTPQTWLFTYIQEIASLMERAIANTDDPNIKVLFSTQKKLGACIFSLAVWLGGRIAPCISAVYSFHLAWKWRESIT